MTALEIICCIWAAAALANLGFCALRLSRARAERDFLDDFAHWSETVGPDADAAELADEIEDYGRRAHELLRPRKGGRRDHAR